MQRPKSAARSDHGNLISHKTEVPRVCFSFCFSFRRFSASSDSQIDSHSLSHASLFRRRTLSPSTPFEECARTRTTFNCEYSLLPLHTTRPFAAPVVTSAILTRRSGPTTTAPHPTSALAIARNPLRRVPKIFTCSCQAWVTFSRTNTSR